MTIVSHNAHDDDLTDTYLGYCPIIEWPYVIEDWHVHPYQPQLIVSVCVYCSEETGDITWHAQPALEARQ